MHSVLGCLQGPGVPHPAFSGLQSDRVSQFFANFPPDLSDSNPAPPHTLSMKRFYSPPFLFAKTLQTQFRWLGLPESFCSFAT